MTPVWYNRVGQEGEVPDGVAVIAHWSELDALLGDAFGG
jgi:hypothetical protein